MAEMWNPIVDWLLADRWVTLLQAALIVLGGLVAGRVLAATAVRALGDRLDAHRNMMLRRTVFYGVVALALASALHQLGFKLGVLLGAAGVMSVAIGFAAQTSFSNLISGLFLVSERSFGIGDTIRVGTTLGEVLSVDLLSVKLRTFDNLYVRIPNEVLIKTEVVNLSRFPIRRVDLTLAVAHKEDLARVGQMVLDVAEANPLCLEEPRPMFLVVGISPSSMDLQLRVWARRENFLQVQSALLVEIRRAFHNAGIEIPFPHMSLYAGTVTEPIPIRFVNEPTAD